MNADQMKEFTPLWSSEVKKYVLVSVNPTSSDLRNCVIVDKTGPAAYLIEDPDVALEVMQRMVDAGVEIVSKLPADVGKYAITD